LTRFILWLFKELDYSIMCKPRRQ